MRTIIALVLSCASALGAENGIRVVTTVKTNQSGYISTKDAFTRDGQTNLVRSTYTKLGVVQIRLHRFYHDGTLAGSFVATTNGSACTTEADSHYSMCFEFLPSKEVRSAVIGTKEGVVIEWFNCTNGLFSPVESSLIRKANDFTKDVRKFFSPSYLTNTPPEAFGRDVEKFLEKHKSK